MLCRNVDNVNTCSMKSVMNAPASPLPRMGDPPDPIQSCNENDRFSLREQSLAPHDGQSTEACAMCRAFNFEWGPGVHDKLT